MSSSLLIGIKEFLAIYAPLHPNQPVVPSIAFRHRLLDFTAAFTRRKSYKATTYSVTEGLEGRAPLNRYNDEVHPHEIHVVDYDTRHSVKRVPAQLPSPSLLHTLPSFMALSAAQLNLQNDEDQITELWMRLAAEYMVQAVVEQFAVFQVERSDVVDKAFKWGFDGDIQAEEGTDDYIVNTMFFDSEADGTSTAWVEIRNEHLKMVTKSKYLAGGNLELMSFVASSSLRDKPPRSCQTPSRGRVFNTRFRGAYACVPRESA